MSEYLTMPVRERKRVSLLDLDLKCADMAGGQVHTATVVFATLGVVDHDGDIFMPGSLGGKKCLFGQWGHTIWEGAVPVGSAETREDGNRAIAEVTFAPANRIPEAEVTWNSMDLYKDLVELSLGGIVMKYLWRDIWEREIYDSDLAEISPVVRGSQPGTAVSMTKSSGEGRTVLSSRAAKELVLKGNAAATVPEPAPEAEPEPEAEPLVEVRDADAELISKMRARLFSRGVTTWL